MNLQTDNKVIKKETMNKYVKYVAVGQDKGIEHPYSTKLGNVNALNTAINCADHPSMRGQVFGEKEDGSRELVYSYKS